MQETTVTRTEGAEKNLYQETTKTLLGTPRKSDFTPITSQEELDRIIMARINRERAKYADYGFLKAKAERYDELERNDKQKDAVRNISGESGQSGSDNDMIAGYRYPCYQIFADLIVVF